jgi:hypothetical protein
MATEAQVTIIGSNLNLTPIEAATWGVAQHKIAMGDAGYDGMAYYPVRGCMALEMALGFETEGFVQAIHQPWREATTIQVATTMLHGVRLLLSGDLAASKANLFEAAMNAGMPRMEHSDGKLARLSERVGGMLLPAIVVHPYGQLLGDGAFGASGSTQGAGRNYAKLAKDPRVGELQWQPSADFAANRGALTSNTEDTVARMVSIAHGDGLGGAAFDTNHAYMQRRGGRRFSNPVAIAAWLAAHGELSMFEFALQPRFGSKITDLQKILDGNIASTPHGEMLAAAASNTQPGQDFKMKVEIPDYAFTGSKEQGQGLGMASAHEGHALLVPIIRNYAVNNLPATA